MTLLVYVTVATEKSGTFIGKAGDSKGTDWEILLPDRCIHPKKAWHQYGEDAEPACYATGGIHAGATHPFSGPDQPNSFPLVHPRYPYSSPKSPRGTQYSAYSVFDSNQSLNSQQPLSAAPFSTG